MGAQQLISVAQDAAFMQLALALADAAGEKGEVPVGAILVDDVTGSVIGRGANAPISMNDPTAHAEILALREAAVLKQNYRLPETTLYVTLEPCVMCVGAILHARVGRVVWAAAEPKMGACGSAIDLTAQTNLNHHCKFEGGLLALESGDKLKAFFKARRG